MSKYKIVLNNLKWGKKLAPLKYFLYTPLVFSVYDLNLLNNNGEIIIKFLYITQKIHLSISNFTHYSISVM